MTTRICTSCGEPHVTSDYYVIEAKHPRRGEIECRAAHEDRVRREVREKYNEPLVERVGHKESSLRMFMRGSMGIRT